MQRYWLFKAEPDVYGIAHLAAAPKKTGRWDGIRNYQARNFLRDEVAVNDQVLFYHSHCKQPGIVGQVRVVAAAYPDPTQFDLASPYYDPKAMPDAPRWVSVDIALEEIFPGVIPLTLLKQQPGLDDMILLRQPRLSIQPVSRDEWQIIQQLRSSI
jgi:predicted RNA-binding protein with PUA-like domain